MFEFHAFSFLTMQITAEDVRNLMLGLLAIVLVYLAIFTGVGAPFKVS